MRESVKRTGKRAGLAIAEFRGRSWTLVQHAGINSRPRKRHRGIGNSVLSYLLCVLGRNAIDRGPSTPGVGREV
jgi:hypothetical protein